MARPRHVLTPAELLRRMPHRFFRPKLSRAQVRDLAIAHVINMDAVHHGEASFDILEQMAGGMLTWCYVASALHIGEPEMGVQLELALRLIKRFDATGRIGYLDQAEYDMARTGVDVMDQLAELVDLATATRAADHSDALMDEMRAARRAAHNS